MLALAFVVVAAVDSVPSRTQLHDACYAKGGATQECVSLLAQSIIGHAKQCFEKHQAREKYTSCASTFCFSECGASEDCSELCDQKAQQAYDFFANAKKQESFRQASVKKSRNGKNDFFGNAQRATDSTAGMAGVPSRGELQEACYGAQGATAECTQLLAKAIIGHSKKCFQKHSEREAYTSCASTFCFSECGENEDCSELCDDKAKQAYEFFSGQKPQEMLAQTAATVVRHQAAEPRDPALDYVSLMEKGSRIRERKYYLRRQPNLGKVDHGKCRVFCQRFMMKALGPAFKDIDHPNECMTKCDEVCTPECPAVEAK